MPMAPPASSSRTRIRADLPNSSIELIDKTLLSMCGTIGGLFLTVKAYFDIRKTGLAMRLGTEGGTSAALLRNRPPFGQVIRQEGIFEHNAGRPLPLTKTQAEVRCKTKKAPSIMEGARVLKFRRHLLSHTVARAVPSAQESLTSVFGMGTGGASPL